MVFFDTCVWIELCAARTPVTANEIRQATAASELLKKILDEGEKIVTCNEQLLEVISAIQKIKLKEYNRIRKESSSRGAGNIKEFREAEEYINVIKLCREAVNDICDLSVKNDMNEYSIEDILDNIDVVDINDYLYYQYCLEKEMDFYTFDHDFTKLGESGKIHIL